MARQKNYTPSSPQGTLAPPVLHGGKAIRGRGARSTLPGVPVERTSALESIFGKYERQAYPYRYKGILIADQIAGGVPSDPKIAEGYIRSKVAVRDDELIADAVAQMMMERGLKETDPEKVDLKKLRDEAVRELSTLKYLNGFKRTSETGELYIEGRNLKACLKEASNIRWPKERWGESRKGTLGFFAEHLFVADKILPLGVSEPSRVDLHFVHTWRGNSFQHLEVVENAKISFEIETDYEFSEEQWGLLWITAEHEGLGASRSQGYGRFTVVGWQEA